MSCRRHEESFWLWQGKRHLSRITPNKRGEWPRQPIPKTRAFSSNISVKGKGRRFMRIEQKAPLGSDVASTSASILHCRESKMTPLHLARDFRFAGVHCGIRSDPQRLDLALVVSDRPAAAAGVFTQNRVR